METGRPPPQSPTPGPQSNFEEALGYIDLVRTRFATRPDVYNGFIRIMKDYWSGTIGIADTTAQVSMLFDGDAELIEGFEAFSSSGDRRASYQ
jgi:paired amphipathic helix protein Sin3a